MKKFILIVFILWAPLTMRGQETTRILFVGNSYTYFWNLPRTVEAMASDLDASLQIRKSTAGGASLKDHWDGGKGLKSREMITGQPWDFVVIQNHSLSSIEHPDEFMEYGRKFVALIKESGATPVLYMTWARKNNPLMKEVIATAYRELATETGAILAPVGELWDQARVLRPDLELYFDDGSHPSPKGTYLTACVFYHVFTGKSPSGLPPRIRTTDREGEVLYLSIMTEEDARFMQQLVDNILITQEATEK